MRFTGTVAEARGAGGRWVECPFDARKEFGPGRPPVVGLTQDVRAAAGIETGDQLDIEIELDPTPREVDAPEDVETLRDGVRHS